MLKYYSSSMWNKLLTVDSLNKKNLLTTIQLFFLTKIRKILVNQNLFSSKCYFQTHSALTSIKNIKIQPEKFDGYTT